MLQLDLRRMNKILEMDSKNMFAVVEPYVVGSTLQAEAMKVGLNTHIVGAGGNTSVLASATSVMGQGTTGVSTGFSNRNLLGFEWVMPDGEILRVGSFDESGQWFTGDGPGPSLRGLIRGFSGAFGGMGVFTKCAVKLYPWYGPAELGVSGVSPDYDLDIPENHSAYMITFPGWDEMADFGNKIGEAEIAFSVSHTAAAPVTAAMTQSNKEFYDLWKSGFLKSVKYSLGVLLTAQSSEEFAYQEGVLRDILKETGGRMMVSSKVDARYFLDLAVALSRMARQAGIRTTLDALRPVLSFISKSMKEGRRPDMFAKTQYLALVKNCLQARGIFRFGGSFWTSMGALTSWDCCIENAKEGERIKQTWIDKGVLMDDGAENAWGGLYENGAYGHLEELAVYDQSDRVCREGIPGFIADTVKATIEKHLAFSLNAVSDPMHGAYSPHCFNYHRYLAGIKEEFDPRDLSESLFYINRERTEEFMDMIESGRELDLGI